MKNALLDPRSKTRARMCTLCSTKRQLIRHPGTCPETQLRVYKISIRVQTRMDVKMMSKLVNRAVINAFSQLDHVSCLATWRETNTS